MSLIRVTRGVPKYNIQIGPLDKALGHNPSAILSVTDYWSTALEQFPNLQWCPINEIGRGWGYRPFFQAKRILDSWCLNLKYPLVSVCCSAGVHRSPLTVFCWLLSFEGATPTSVSEEFVGTFRDMPLTMYDNDIRTGYIPNDLPTFYKVMRENPTWSYQGVLQSMLKYERITYITDSEAIRII